MSDIKFSCPQCQQHIQCEEGYAGMEIGCPSCSARMVVPGRPAAPPPPPPPSPPPSNPCPGCGAALAPAAILCVHCGYNLRTGQRTTARSASVPAGDAWWRSSNLYIGLLVVALAVLYYFARSNNEGALLGYLALFVLFSLTVQIIVIVAAFRENVGTGFLTLCIPFYAIYFVYFRSESPLLRKLYTVSIIATLASRTLKGIE